MKLRGFVFSLVGVAALLTVFGQGRAPRNETQRLHDLALTAPVSEGLTPAKKQQLATAYGKLPLSFEANQGRTDPHVKFISRGTGYSLFLTPTEAVLTLRSSSQESKVEARKPEAKGAGLLSRSGAANEFLKKRGAADLQDRSALQETVLRTKLAGANPAPKISGVDELPGKSNYFIGNDPKKWRTNVLTYAKVKYQGVYPGVEVVYHGTQGKLEYDFVVAPGADPGVIRLSFEGADQLELDAQGDLVLHTAAGEVRERKPVVYQEIVGVRQAIAGSYVLRSKAEVGFAVAPYDKSEPLVIDPALVYSTYLGGSDFDEGFHIAVDSGGNAYVTGGTTSINFPTAGGPYQAAVAGGTDAFVAKLNPTGTALVYSTYLGGSGFDEGHGIAVDPGCGPAPAAPCNAYVTGETSSPNFPVSPTSGAFQKTFGGGSSDAFVAKLNPAGTALVYSTYLGGSGNRGDFGLGIAVDLAGGAYVTGYTDSTNFPTTKGAFQTTFGGGVCYYGYYTCFDAFVTKLNPTGTALLYSTYLGGSGDDFGQGIAVDSGGNAYVTGGTGSNNFPTTTGAFQLAFGGGSGRAFVTKLNPTGTVLVYSTYLGGSSFDEGFGIAVDPGCGPVPAAPCNAYVTGETMSADFPTTSGAFQTSLGGTSATNAFVTKLDPAGMAPLAYSTYLGGSSSDQGFAIAVDSLGNAYVTGETMSANFPTTTDAFQPINAGGFDAFVTKLNPTGTALLYSTYLGGSGDDFGQGIAVDSGGNAYVTGGTGSNNFPTTTGAFQLAFVGGSSDAFVSKIVEGPPPVDFLLSATPASQTVAPGASTSYTINITRTGGFTGAVTLSAAGLPAGATPTFSPNPASGNSSTVTVTTATTTPTGSFTVTITGASGSLTHTTLVVVIVPDFSLSATPASQTVAAGASTSYTVNITPTGGFTAAVTFSAAGLPAGATPTFSPNPASGNSSTVTVTTATTTPAGSFTVTITGASGSLTHTTSVTLVVTADFSLSATPASQTVAAGASTSYTVNITPTGGFTGAVTFSAAGLPTGATLTFSPNPASGNSSTVTVTTTARGLLAPWPKLRLPPATFSVRVWPLWAIGLLVLVLLAYRTKTRRQAAVWVFAATVLVVLLLVACGGGSPTPTQGTPAGTSALTLTGVSGSLTHTTTVTLTVN